ncbi:MAG: PDZ domain-containing protein [Verrucomicrobiota bacterium]
MKLSNLIICLSAAAFFSSALPASAQENVSNSKSSSQSSSSSSSSQSSRSVSVYSDGKRTTKKTVIVENGVEKVITEVTDENGNTIRTEGGDPKAADPAGKGEPWLGVSVSEVSKTLRSQLGLANIEGVSIDSVASNSPADKAGIKEGDLLLALANRSISTSAELEAKLRELKVGDTVSVNMMREGKRGTLQVTLEENPNSPPPGAPPAGLLDGFGIDLGKGQINISVDGDDAFDAILNDENVPDSFKDTIRDMQRKVRDFEKQNGLK